MVTVELDENKYFTGKFAMLGGIPNGVLVPSLPPDIYNDKETCWKYDIVKKEVEVQIPVEGKVEQVPIIDETTKLQKVDNQGQPMFKTVKGKDELIIETRVVSTLEWVFDEEKYNVIREEKLLADLRAKREEAFVFIDKLQLPLYYNSLDEEQKEALATYRQEWLDVTETKQIPIIPECLNK